MEGTGVNPSRVGRQNNTVVPHFRVNLVIPIKLNCMFLESGWKLEYLKKSTDAQGEHANII